MANERARQFKCTKEGCGVVVDTEIPEGVIINKPTFSMLVMVHEVATVCPNCGQGYGFLLRGIKGVEMGWVPVELAKPPEESGIITVPHIPDAMLTELLKKKGN